MARLIINKIKTQIINFPISINLKLYSCFTIIPMKHSKVVEILNKALSKKLYKIKPKELFSILYANYKCCPQEYYLKNENIGFFQTLLKEIEKKSSIEFLNNKQLNLFLEILVSNKFSFPNKNLMIDLIIHQQLNYFTRIIKIKTSIPQEEGEILYLPLFSSFLRKLNEINFQIEEILNLFAFIERQKVNFNVNNYLNMLSFLLNKKESSTSKTLEINNLISFLCFSLSESNLFMIYPENFPNFIECLVRLEGTQDKKITQKILKRAFGFFANAIQKFSDLDLSYSLVFLKSLCEKSDFPILEMLTKAINKHILKTEYHTFEEIEEINKLRANFNENNQIQRISSYLFLKESFNENFKFLIKRHTQIINMCWVCCNLFLKNPQNYELKPSVLWREFTHCLNNVGVPELLTYDNIQKLYEIKILMEINKFLGTDSLFQNPIFVSVFKDQEKFVLSTFLERKKKLRNLLKAEFEQQLQKKDNIKVEICQILNNIIPLDIVISKKNETNIIIQKIAIVIVNINEERNSELINNINAFREYLRIKENYIKSYFGGEVYFIVKEDQCSTLIDEVLPKLI